MLGSPLQYCLCRDLNAATSQEVFAGPYLGDEASRATFSTSFQHMTQGFLSVPICFPGTAVWRGRQGRLWILRLLTKGAALAKKAIKAGPAALVWCAPTGLSVAPLLKDNVPPTPPKAWHCGAATLCAGG